MMTSKRTTAVKWLSIAAIVGSVMLLMRALPLEQLQGVLKQWIDGLGFWGPFAFVLVYITITVCLVPGSIVTLAAGAIFGLWIGFIVTTVGANLGAAAAFLIARYLARKKVEAMARSNPKFSAIDEAISEGGWKVVALLRLSPAIPFNLQNYLYGLTDIKFWPYFLTSFVAMLPGTFMYVYLGHVAGVAATSGGETSTAQWALLTVGLVATVVVTVYITRLAKKKLNEQTHVADVEETASSEDAAESNDNRESSGKVYLFAILAAILLALSIAAQFQNERIATILKPMLGGEAVEVEPGE